MNYPTYSGMYTGIVVQTNDPQKRGRVKIFVPLISPSVYSGWNSINKDKQFKFIGVNTYSSHIGSRRVEASFAVGRICSALSR